MAIVESSIGLDALVSGIPLWSVGMITFTAALTAVVLRRIHRTVVLVILLGVFTGLEGLVIIINARQSQALVALSIMTAILSWLAFTAELLYLYQRIRTFLPQIEHVWTKYVVFVFIAAISLTRLAFGVANETSIGNIALGTTGGSRMLSLGTVKSLGTGVINLLTIVFDVVVSLILIYSLSSKFTRRQQFSNTMFKFLASSRLRVLVAMIFGLLSVILSVFITDVTHSTTINSLEAAKDTVYIADTVILLLLTNTYVTSNRNDNIATTVYYGDSRRPSDASTTRNGLMDADHREKSVGQSSTFNRPVHMLNESWDAMMPRDKQTSTEQHSIDSFATASKAFPPIQPRPVSKGLPLPPAPASLVGSSSQFQQGANSHASWTPQRPAPAPPVGGPFGQQKQRPLTSRPVFGAINWQSGTAAAARAPIRVSPPPRPDLIQQQKQQQLAPSARFSLERSPSRQSNASEAKTESIRSKISESQRHIEQVDHQKRRTDLAVAVRSRQSSQSSTVRDRTFSIVSLAAIQGRQRTPSDFPTTSMLSVPHGRHDRNGSDSSIETTSSSSSSSSQSVVSHFLQPPAPSPIENRSLHVARRITPTGNVINNKSYTLPSEPPNSALPSPPLPLQISKRRTSPPRLQIPVQNLATTPIQIVFSEAREINDDAEGNSTMNPLTRSESSGSDNSARPVTGHSMRSFASVSVYSGDTSSTDQGQGGLQRANSTMSAYAEDAYAETNQAIPPMPTLPSPYKNQSRPDRPFQ